ncbi:MAG: hypothetical protein N4A64_03810 [Marinisporobacter sp.]|jgi:hypothetical protein|nr:hypothetical protein [Marinisporobacter sp.]
MSGISSIFVLINIAFMIYVFYLFHTLAMSNKQMAESMEKLVEKMDQIHTKK